MALMEYLKENCHQHHNKIRSGEYARKIMDHSLELAEYATLLLSNYVFHSVLENGCSQVLSKEQSEAFDLKSRIKSTYAVEDLAMLGVDYQTIIGEVTKPEFEIDSLEDALGALYVMEGTSIGGALIKKELLKNQRFLELPAIHFFGCYGKALSPRWKSFQNAMDGFTGDVDAQSVIEAALRTFSFYERVLEQVESKVLVVSDRFIGGYYSVF